MQSALAEGPIRIRIGIHTGEALVIERHYVGMDVHRAARIGACGHGGQVVISPATASQLEPDAFSLKDLGPHRLKDLAAAVVLYQLGDAEFPRLKALFGTNLPVPATPFLGREGEVRVLAERLAEPAVRLLTLTGPGGTGKTRLSLQVAAELAESRPGGVWWVPLAQLRDGALVASAVADVLELTEEPGRALADVIVDSLGSREALLVLDNCEHLVDGVAELVSRLLASCPGLRVLATSREPLSVSGEHVAPVAPLEAEDAVALFEARARAAGAPDAEDADVVRELCAHLDNLPLAVELAAARTVAIPAAALLDRLGSRLDLLKGPRDAGDRQRTLRATIEWSHDLLSDDERLLFQRTAVFPGGATLDALEEICAADLDDVFSLVGKSLVRQTTTGDGLPRYWMLETIREFAAERLAASGELDAVRAHHLDWYAELARVVGHQVEDSGEQLERLELELENFRAAFDFAAAAGERANDAFAIGDALITRHTMRGRYLEAEDVARRALALELEPLDEVLLRDRLGVALRLQGRPGDAIDSYRAAVEILDGLADRSSSWWERWIDLRLDQAHLFYFQNDQPELEKTIDELEAALETHGTTAQRRELLHVRAQHRYRVERYGLSAETEAVARRIHTLDIESGEVTADFTLGFCLLWRGKLDEAEDHLERGLEVARARGVALVETRCLVYGLVARRRQDDLERARERLAELEAVEELHGYEGLVNACAAWIRYRDGDYARALERGEQALAHWAATGRAGQSVFQWTARFPLLGVAVAQGDLGVALEHAQAMLDPLQQPLPQALAASLDQAIEHATEPDIALALGLARPLGYA